MKISQEAEDVRRPEEKRVLIDDFEANYKTQGSGPLLLILHGWGGSSDSWVFVQKFLAEKGFQVICPDLPGFGKTPPPLKDWSIDDYVEWLKQFCEKISQIHGESIEPFFLLGHSFGGGVAVKFATKYPNFISSLVLVAPAIVRQRKIKQKVYFALAKTGNKIFSLPILFYFQPFLRKILYRLLGLTDYYKLFVEKSIAMKGTFKKIVSEDLQRLLSQIPCKTLLIWGGRDKVTLLGDAYLIQKKIPSANLKIIPEAGHVPNFETPEKLAEIILKFLLEKN